MALSNRVKYFLEEHSFLCSVTPARSNGLIKVDGLTKAGGLTSLTLAGGMTNISVAWP